MTTPTEQLTAALRSHSLVRFYEQIEAAYHDIHLKELCVDSVGPNREMTVLSRDVINFGFDSFLGLDQDSRVAEAICRGAKEWGTQFGASRAFAQCAIETALEEKIARWMGTEAALIFPSVTLANMGILPGLVSSQDVIAVDEYAHNSIQEACKVAKANGVRVLPFKHNDAEDLDRVLAAAEPYRSAVVAIDGVYSMSGVVAAMPELNEVALRRRGVLYIDDAHATAVLGHQGRGTVLQSLGSYDNTIVVGCFSKACSVFGAFAACAAPLQRLLKMRSSTYIFGGPVPPPYLEAISTVIDLLSAEEYGVLRERLDENVRQLLTGLRALDLVVLGGLTPIITILVGDEEEALKAGYFLFERGYYVQSVTFPAVPYHCSVLRIQVNANHTSAAIDGLLTALADLRGSFKLPQQHDTDAALAFGSDSLQTA